MSLFEKAVVVHLVADWLLQNDWMARNKTDLRHPAAWVHSGIQGIALGCVLGWRAGLVLGILHILVDTRVPLRWWQRVCRQTTDGPVGVLVSIMSDQVVHIVCIAAVVWWMNIDWFSNWLL